jgi:hypothetical protein
VAFDPITMITMGLSLAGGVMQGMAARNASLAQAQAAQYNAAIQERNARAAVDQASAERGDARRDSRRRLDRIRSLYAGSGIDAGAGSALAVFQDQATEDKLQQMRISYKGRIRETGYKEQAVLDKMEARSARSAASLGMAAGVIGGLGSALQIAG